MVVGDFKQIEPVRCGDDPAVCAFNSNIWKTALPHVLVLQKNFRRIGHKRYAEVLMHIANGEVDDSDLAYLNSLCRDIQDDSDTTHLYYRRRDVRFHNTVTLETLPGTTQVNRAKMHCVTKRNQFKRHCPFPELLELKVGARVMLLVNLDDIHHNGSLTKVIGFSDKGDPILCFTRSDTTMELQKKTVEVRPTSQRFLGTITQYPVDLAYAVKIHKSQEKTLANKVIAHLEGEFSRGQAYVALSRSPNPENLSIVGLSHARVLPPPDDDMSFYSEASPGCFDDHHICCRRAVLPNVNPTQDYPNVARQEVLQYLDEVFPTCNETHEDPPNPSADRD